MRLQFTINVDLSPRRKRWFTRFGIAAALILIIAGAARAAGVTFVTGDPLNAADLNSLQMQITALQQQAANSQPVSYTPDGGATVQVSTNALFCGFTSQTTSGAITNLNTNHTGYVAARELCAQEPSCGTSSLAHMCTIQELAASAQLGVSVPSTPASAWYSAMVFSVYFDGSGAAESEGDCFGFTSADATQWGKQIRTAQSGAPPYFPSHNPCSTASPIACCR